MTDQNTAEPLHEIENYFGQTVAILDAPRNTTEIELGQPTETARIRHVDLRGWFLDRPTMTYRRRNPVVPSQTDLTLSASMIRGLSVTDAALLLEAEEMRRARYFRSSFRLKRHE